MGRQQIIVDVADPDDQLAGYGAGALVRIERDSASDMANANEIAVIAIVSGQTQYEYWDDTGISTDWYRTRYSTAAPALTTDYSDYSPVFQVNTGPQEYVSEAQLKAQISIPDAVDDTLLAVICDRVNQYIETTTEQPIGPIPSATYLYDSDGLSRLYTPMPVDAATKGIGGFRSVSLVEIASYTAGTYTTVASTDYFLRGRHGVIGPYKWLCLSDLPVGINHTFPRGRATVRVTGTAGWPEIPDDLTMVAVEMAKRAWNARQAGAQEALDEQGVPIVARLVSGQERQTLWKYTLKMPY